MKQMAAGSFPVLSAIHYVLGDRQPLSALCAEGATPKQLADLQARGLRHFCSQAKPVADVFREATTGALSGILKLHEVDAVLVVSSPIDQQSVIQSLRESGLNRAWLLGLDFQDCGGCEAALRIAADLVAGNSRVNRVLVFIHGKVPEGESRIGWGGETVFSDGAAACVVSRTGVGFEILASEIITNPNLVWYRAAREDTRYYEECMASLIDTSRWALQAAQIEAHQLAKLFATNGNRSYHNIIASALRVAPKTIYGQALQEYGHVFSCDSLIGLSDYTRAGWNKDERHFMTLSWSPYVIGATVLRAIGQSG